MPFFGPHPATLGEAHVGAFLTWLATAQHVSASTQNQALAALEHSLGRFKARFFGALGFAADHWEELESALRAQHLTQEVELASVVRGGQKFTIRAILSGPNGQSAAVVSVWFIRVGEAVPRFVTAYPGGSQ